jgi:hypothetical protein
VADNGAFFPQGRVRANGREGLFDDVVGEGWRLVASDPSVLQGLGAEQRAFWQGLGGETVAFGGEGGLEDLEGVYGAWFAANGCAAAIVRPDWYVFGTAKHGAGLDSCLAQLADSLKPQASAPSARALKG